MISKLSLKKCKECGGIGKIYVYRGDLEEFDEIICPECHGKEK
jgi:DnaJ-class molecular chaperone